MKVLRICKNLKDKIEKNGVIKGYIHSIFKSAFNIVTESEEVITLLAWNRDMSPMSIVVKNPVPFTNMGLEQGMKVRIYPERLKIHKFNIKTDLSIIDTWDPKPYRIEEKIDENVLISNLILIEKFLYERGNHQGISPIAFNIGSYIPILKPYTYEHLEDNQYTLFIIDRVISFFQAIINKDIDNISFKTREIVGFGPGLTPSVDDFLSGLMISFLYFSQYYELSLDILEEFNKEIIRDIDSRTTRISIQSLKNSAIGEASEVIRSLIISMFSKEETNLLGDLEKVIAFGDTSGTDISTGIYLGSKLMVNRDFREGFNSGYKVVGQKEHIL